MIYCESTWSVVMVGCMDERGVLHFPVENGLPGLLVDCRKRQLIADAANDRWSEWQRNWSSVSKSGGSLGTPMPMEIFAKDHHPISIAPDQEGIMYLARVSQSLPRIAELPTLPELLRATPAGNRRIQLVRAWQIFAGASREDSRALVGDEALKAIGSVLREKTDS